MQLLHAGAGVPGLGLEVNKRHLLDNNRHGRGWGEETITWVIWGYSGYSGYASRIKIGKNRRIVRPSRLLFSGSCSHRAKLGGTSVKLSRVFLKKEDCHV